MTRSLGAALLVGMLGFAAACDDSPTSPTEVVTFTATLLPANEVPPVTGPEATGTGAAAITLTVTRDSGGTITSAVADFQVSMTGFPAGTPLTIAHIHRGASGTATPGNIVVDTGLAPGQIVLTNGAGVFARTAVTVQPTIATELLANPAGFYFNVHSVLNPPGMARGQLTR